MQNFEEVLFVKLHWQSILFQIFFKIKSSFKPMAPLPYGVKCFSFVGYTSPLISFICDEVNAASIPGLCSPYQ